MRAGTANAAPQTPARRSAHARGARPRRPTSSRGRQPGPEQGSEHPEPVEGSQLLTFLGGTCSVVDGDLEDALASLYETRRDLRLDREPRGIEWKAAEDVGPDHLVAGH